MDLRQLAGLAAALLLGLAEAQTLAYDKPLCASLDGFTLHAATRAGALDPSGREASRRPGASTLKKVYADGTLAVDMDPLSLLCRLAARLQPPRFQSTTRACSRRPVRGDRVSHPNRRRSRPPPPTRDVEARRGLTANWAFVTYARTERA